MKLNDKNDPLYISETVKESHRIEHWMKSKITGIVMLMATIGLDAFVIFNFAVAARVNGIMQQFATTFAFLLVLDILFPMCAILWKQQYSKYEETPKLLVIAGLVTVVFFVTLMIVVRLAVITEAEMAMYGAGAAVKAIVLGSLPLATSLSSFFQFWISFSPLDDNIELCEQTLYSDNLKLQEVARQLARYNCEDKEYRLRLEEEEERRYQHKFMEINAIAEDLKVSFRQKLAEILADPTSADQLSQYDVEMEVAMHDDAPDDSKETEVRDADSYNSNENTSNNTNKPEGGKENEAA